MRTKTHNETLYYNSKDIADLLKEGRVISNHQSFNISMQRKGAELIDDIDETWRKSEKGISKKDLTTGLNILKQSKKNGQALHIASVMRDLGLTIDMNESAIVEKQKPAKKQSKQLSTELKESKAANEKLRNDNHSLKSRVNELNNSSDELKDKLNELNESIQNNAELLQEVNILNDKLSQKTKYDSFRAIAIRSTPDMPSLINILDILLINVGLFRLFEYPGLFLGAMATLYLIKAQQNAKRFELRNSNRNALKTILHVSLASFLLHLVTFYNAQEPIYIPIKDELNIDWLRLIVAVLPAVFVSVFSYKAVEMTVTVSKEENKA